MASVPKKVFETERLIARRWVPEDAPDLFAIYSHPEVTRFLTGTRVSTMEEIHDRLPRILGTYERYGPGFGVWAAVRKEDALVLGMVLLKGYATERGAGALRHGFERQGLREIHAVVDPGNVASVAVAERLKMTLRGRTEAYYGGEPVDHFTLKREDWGRSPG